MMTGALVQAGATPALPAADVERAFQYAREGHAAATRAAYRADFAAFTAWCSVRSVPALPAASETVAAYLAAEAEAGMKPSTIGRRCAAIRYAHRLAGHEPPTNTEMVKATLRGIRRRRGAAPRRMAPAVAEIAKDMARAAPESIKGLRDRALLLLGFAGAFRRSELVALDVADIEETEEGLRVTIRRSKTDQEGHGVVVAVVRGGVCCPVRAVRAWLDAAGIAEGPIFRMMHKGGAVTQTRLSPKSANKIVKAYAAAVGLDASMFGAHSLRAGAATTAARRGAPLHKIQQLTRHRSVDVLMGYIRDAELFGGHALEGAL